LLRGGGSAARVGLRHAERGRDRAASDEAAVRVVAGEIVEATAEQEAWLAARIRRLKAEVDKHYWTFTRCARVNPAAMVAAHQPLSFAERVLRRIWRRRHRLNHRQERAA